MPNPGSRSLNVTLFCVFIVLPQACAASPALENSPYVQPGHMTDGCSETWPTPCWLVKSMLAILWAPK